MKRFLRSSLTATLAASLLTGVSGSEVIQRPAGARSLDADSPCAESALSARPIWIHAGLNRLSAAIIRGLGIPQFQPASGPQDIPDRVPREPNRFIGWDQWRPANVLMMKRRDQDAVREAALREEMNMAPKRSLTVLQEWANNRTVLERILRKMFPSIPKSRVSWITNDLYRLFGPKSLSEIAKLKSLRGRAYGRNLLAVLREALSMAAMQQYRIEKVPLEAKAYLELLPEIGGLERESKLSNAPIAAKMFGALRLILETELSPSATVSERDARPSVLGFWVAKDFNHQIVGVQILKRAGARQDQMSFLAAIEDQGIVEGVAAVLPSTQRRGIANQLLNEALRSGRKWNVRYRLLCIDSHDEVSLRLFYKAVRNGHARMRYLGSISSHPTPQDLFLIDRFPGDPHPVRRMGHPLQGPAEQAIANINQRRVFYDSRQELSDALIRQGFVRRTDLSLRPNLMAAEPPPDIPRDVYEQIRVILDLSISPMIRTDALYKLTRVYGYRAVEILPMTPEQYIFESLLEWSADIERVIPTQKKLGDELLVDAIFKTVRALATNIIEHGGKHGLLLFRPVDSGRHGLEIIAQDAGPGIRHIKQVAQRGRDLPSVRHNVVNSGFGTFTAESNGNRMVWDRRGLVESIASSIQVGSRFIVKYMLSSPRLSESRSEIHSHAQPLDRSA